jgi:transposase-like protein
VGMAGKNANIVVVKIEQNNFVTIDIIKRYVVSGSTLFTAKGICEDNFSCYGYKHCEIGNKETELLFHKKCMLNTIHSFSSYSKRRMIQFSGSGCRDCFLYFNECAFRFTHRNVSMYDAMLPILKINSRYSVLATKTRKQNRRRTSGPDLPIISC